MLTTLCKYLNNYFIHDRSAFHFGEFEIEDGEFIGGLEFLQDGQYFRICGSVFNDGVYPRSPMRITDRAVEEIRPNTKGKKE